MDALKKFIELDTQRRKVQRDLADIKVLVDLAEVDALDYFVEQGIQSLKFEGVNYSIRSERRASKVDSEEPPESICNVLRANGFEDFVSTGVGWQGLSQLFRERDDNGETPVPKALADVLQLHVKHRISSRKAY